MHRAELHSYLLTRRCTLVHPPSTGPSSPIFSVRPSFDQFSSFPPLSLPPFPSFSRIPAQGMKSLAGVIHDAQDASMRPFDSRHSYNSVAPVKWLSFALHRKRFTRDIISWLLMGGKGRASSAFHHSLSPFSSPSRSRRITMDIETMCLDRVKLRVSRIFVFLFFSGNEGYIDLTFRASLLIPPPSYIAVKTSHYFTTP